MKNWWNYIHMLYPFWSTVISSWHFVFNTVLVESCHTSLHLMRFFTLSVWFFSLYRDTSLVTKPSIWVKITCWQANEGSCKELLSGGNCSFLIICFSCHFEQKMKIIALVHFHASHYYFQPRLQNWICPMRGRKAILVPGITLSSSVDCFKEHFEISKGEVQRREITVQGFRGKYSGQEIRVVRREKILKIR